jgi:homocysteine S-methyltransferase
MGGVVQQFQERLQRGEVVILDGAMGTELQRRGVPMHSVAWSAAALLTHPDTVRQVHADYIRAGADIIITNTFSAGRHVLEPAGMADRVAEVNTRAVRLAQEAREQAAGGRPTVIAGSISIFMPKDDHGGMPPPEKAQASYQEQAQLLAEAGADLIMLEMLRDTVYSRCAIEAAVATGLPVWAGFSCKPAPDGVTVMLRDGKPGETFAQALETLIPLGVSAVCVMHTEVEHTIPALQVVTEHWQGPVGAYPHSGGWRMPHWQFDDIIPPDELVEQAKAWVQMGSQVVGTCCGMGPEYIRLLSQQLPPRRQKA